MLRGYQWSHQLQIIQEFFIITTPIVKLFALGDKQSLHLLAQATMQPNLSSNLNDKILTAIGLVFAILVRVY